MAISYYQQFQNAYDFYNERLFDGELQDCLIVFQRKTRTFGYISYDRHSIVGDTQYLHELALNPDYFAYRTVIETLSTLVHEMCHLKQHMDGTETRKTYHNKEFSTLMFERGLQTSHTGEEEGKPVGQNMSHYILPDGKFLEVTLEFLRETDFKNFYDRFTPNYIEPSDFYRRSLKFISRMQDRVKLEDIIPPYLIKHFSENPQLLSGGEEDQPTIEVQPTPDDEVTALSPEPDEPIDDIPTEPAEPVETVEIEAVEGEDEAGQGITTEIEDDQGEDELQATQEDEEEGEKTTQPVSAKVDLTSSEITKLKPAEVKLLNPTQIAKALSNPENLVKPIQEMLNQREQERITEALMKAATKPSNSKHKFSCECGNNLWGKATLNVICGDCDKPFELAD